VTTHTSTMRVTAHFASHPTTRPLKNSFIRFPPPGSPGLSEGQNLANQIIFSRAPRGSKGATPACAPQHARLELDAGVRSPGRPRPD
jgi:hypothetical protein